MTDVTLELLTDIDMHLMIEEGVRGGVSTIVTRHAKANNKYMPEYDPKEKSIYLLDLDANNLYGWAMSQPLPTDTFSWVSEEDFDQLYGKVMELDKNAPIGYIFWRWIWKFQKINMITLISMFQPHNICKLQKICLAPLMKSALQN